MNVARLAGALAAVLLLLTSPASAAVVDPVHAIRIQLGELRVEPEGAVAPYTRAAFGDGWSTVTGCRDTRAVVLARSSRSAVTFGSSGCTVAAGSWWSAYDATEHTVAGELDVDHVVALEEAWSSGADGWTTAARLAFANDLRPGHLVAVTASVNRSKGAHDPAGWRPPSAGAWCQFAVDWVSVKRRWSLSVDEAERTALTTLLDRC